MLIIMSLNLFSNKGVLIMAFANLSRVIPGKTNGGCGGGVITSDITVISGDQVKWTRLFLL